MRDCSAYGLGLIFPRSACLRLILFFMCPPLCVGALWPMPAWVWRDVRSVFCFYTEKETAAWHGHEQHKLIIMTEPRYVWASCL